MTRKSFLAAALSLPAILTAGALIPSEESGVERITVETEPLEFIGYVYSVRQPAETESRVYAISERTFCLDEMARNIVGIRANGGYHFVKFSKPETTSQHLRQGHKFLQVNRRLGGFMDVRLSS